MTQADFVAEYPLKLAKLATIEQFPYTALKSRGALALLYRQGFRGSYDDICRELGWVDRFGKTQRSMVTRAIRQAKEKGLLPQHASFRAA
jgi:hypothetical protein